MHKTNEFINKERKNKNNEKVKKTAQLLTSKKLKILLVLQHHC